MRSVRALVRRLVRPMRDAESGTPNLLLVEAIWLDAHGGTTGWTAITDLDMDPCVIHSVGYLLPENEGGKPGHTTLAQSVGGGEVDNVLHIPAGMVQSCNTLKETP